MKIFIQRLSTNERAIKMHSPDPDALLHCRNLLKRIIPSYLRRYDRSLRCWVVSEIAHADMHHFLCFAEAFIPAEVHRRLAA